MARHHFLVMLLFSVRFDTTCILSADALSSAGNGSGPHQKRISTLKRSGQSNLNKETPEVNAAAQQRRQESLQAGRNPLLSLNLNLDALAKENAPERAEELLQRIQNLYNEGYYEVSPDVVSFNTVLAAWKESNDKNRAVELFENMPIRDIYSYNTLLWLFAKQADHPSTMSLLRKMEQEDSIQPDVISYNACLYSFAASTEPGVALKGESLLKEIIAKEVVRPDAHSFNICIYLWSQVAARARRQGDAAISASKRAYELLNHMEQLYDAGNLNVEPDVYSYSTVIQAFSYAQQPLKAQEVINQMVDRGLQPNRFTYTSILTAMAKLGHAEQAQELLEDMLLDDAELQPDTVCFSVVMDAWAKKSSTETPWAADRALALLERMYDLGIEPNEYTISSLFTALGNSGQWDAAERAHLLLKDMENENSIRVSTIHYNTVISAYARSPRADKALKAFAVLQALQTHSSESCKPDIISWNTVLLACANAFGNDDLKDKSFAIALHAFRSAMEADDLVPTSTTISHFCKSTRRLISDQRRRLTILNKVFQVARKKGLMTSVIVQQLQMACQTDEEWIQVLGEASARMLSRSRRASRNQIPYEWRKNAKR